eukprot:TRINITY_DN15990_c0_g1_i1.p1 TRINITY_DN15990_c0_g1~~TRINITY_DN15990_c0_g1_i1.p1  ORF type:complete len:171 (+),score=49.31 TRINITY_DN15990_c0_g1_i1:61-513(+)
MAGPQPAGVGAAAAAAQAPPAGACAAPAAGGGGAERPGSPEAAVQAELADWFPPEWPESARRAVSAAVAALPADGTPPPLGGLAGGLGVCYLQLRDAERAEQERRAAAAAAERAAWQLAAPGGALEGAPAPKRPRIAFAAPRSAAATATQ